MFMYIYGVQNNNCEKKMNKYIYTHMNIHINIKIYI